MRDGADARGPARATPTRRPDDDGAARRARAAPPRPQEHVNGQLKNKYGDAFIRGNNVLYISTVKDSKDC